VLDTVPTKDWQLQVHHDDGAKIFVNGVLAADLSAYLTNYQTVVPRPEAHQALRKGVNVLSVTCEDAGRWALYRCRLRQSSPSRITSSICKPVRD
jgi:hypothetical protein